MLKIPPGKCVKKERFMRVIRTSKTEMSNVQPQGLLVNVWDIPINFNCKIEVKTLKIPQFVCEEKVFTTCPIQCCTSSYLPLPNIVSPRRQLSD